MVVRRTLACAIFLVVLALLMDACDSRELNVVFYNKTDDLLREVKAGRYGLIGGGLTLPVGGTAGYGFVTDEVPDSMVVSWVFSNGEEVQTRVEIPEAGSIGRHFKGTLFFLIRREGVEVAVVPDEEELRFLKETGQDQNPGNTSPLEVRARDQGEQ